MSSDFLDFATFDFFSTLLRYALLSILPLVILKYFMPNFFSKYKIKNSNKSKYKVELKYSMISFISYCFADFLVIILMREWSVSKIYDDFGVYGLTYEALVIVLLFISQDLSFYLIHRFLHKKWAFKKVHYVHHLSRKPNPLTAYSFHPVEAVSMSLFFIVLTLFLPINLMAAGVYFFFSHLYNSYGHSGYDFFIKQDSLVNRWLLTSTRHNKHHSHNKGNFGLYTTIWDRFFKTLDE